ncbi:hypothetical protein ACFLKB_14580 [Clostridium sp. FAM 1755]|uniref:hypothetical protein n=1 Tax=Clostridium caseinilyticum TaxID=3350403 RepID=UPI0038F7231B
MSKYLYTAYDIARFFVWADFTRSHEVYIRNLIWSDGNIAAKYKKDKIKFVRDIQRALEQLNNKSYFNEIELINSVLLDVGSKFTIKNMIDEENNIDFFLE